MRHDSPPNLGRSASARVRWLAQSPKAWAATVRVSLKALGGAEDQSAYRMARTVVRCTSRSLFGNSQAAPGLRCRGRRAKRSSTKGWQGAGLRSQLGQIPRIGLTNAIAARDSDDW